MTYTARDWRLAIAAIYAAFLFAIMAWTGSPGDFQGWLFVFAVYGFGLLPIALLCLIATHPLAHGIGAGLLAAFGIYAHVTTLFIAPPDAQSALVFLFVPFYQLAAAAIWVVVVALVSFVVARKATTRRETKGNR